MDFSRRHHIPEMLDDPAVPASMLRETFPAMYRVNVLSGGVRASVDGIRRLVPESKRSIDLLDVGTGDGSFMRHVRSSRQLRDLDVSITGIDLLSEGIELARRKSRGADNYRVENVFDVEGAFDIVHASLFLHHFHGQEILKVLRKMSRSSRLGVVINDLHRHPIAYWGAKILLPFVTGDEMVQNDGPISVLRAFNRRELTELMEELDVSSHEISWHFPFRWCLTFES